MDAQAHRPGGFAWSGDIAMRWRDLDAFGHLYYGEYLVLIDEARVAMLAAALGHATDFVVVRIELDYRGEVVLDDGPLAAFVQVERVGRTSVTLRELLSTKRGRIAVESRCVVVLWDAVARMGREVTDAERTALMAEK